MKMRVYIQRHSLHVDRMFEPPVVCPSDPQFVARVVLDRFGDSWEGLAELPHHVPQVTVHVDLDMDVGKVLHVGRAPERGQDAGTTHREHNTESTAIQASGF